MLRSLVRDTAGDFGFSFTEDDFSAKTISEDRSRGSQYEKDRLSALFETVERSKALHDRCDPKSRGFSYDSPAMGNDRPAKVSNSDPNSDTEEDDERLNRPQLHRRRSESVESFIADRPKIAPAGSDHFRSLTNGKPNRELAVGNVPAETLADELAKCKAELQSLRGTIPIAMVKKSLVIYQVKENSDTVEDGKTMISERWLDRPRWLYGDRGRKSMQGSLPLSSVAGYTSRHPEICFLVYRTFDPTKDAKAAQESAEEEEVDAGLPQWSEESISIVSDRLQKTCDNVFAKLTSTQSASELSKSESLVAPYLMFYHHRSKLESFAADIPQRSLDEWNLLVNYVLDSQREEYSQVDGLIAGKRITNAHIHYLFKPNEHVVSRRGGLEVGFFNTAWPKAHSMSQDDLTRHLREQGLAVPNEANGDNTNVQKKAKEHQGWKLRAYNFYFTENFSKQWHELVVTGMKDGNEPYPIHELGTYPLEFATPEVQELLKTRGERFWKCHSKQYVSYNYIGEEDPATFTGDRYMVDFKTYLKLHPQTFSAPADEDIANELQNSEEPPKEPFLLLLPTELKGYNLRTKKWVDLQVDRITNVVWNEVAFENLVINSKTKVLIKALVTSLLAAERSTDLISGKGNGLTMLLHGGPGTGKTFTAESVAEIAHKPLYRVTCGDIGTTPKDVETYLESVLYLGKIWDCVVLLDEADVFLEQRSLHDLQRNALVSTFLRVLEYYNGILILTSNRVGHFDEAFRSRIQLALHYKPLAREQRKQIWRNFFRRLEDLEPDKIDSSNLMRHVEDLADHEMNGREIRNSITLSRQLAMFRRQNLDYETLRDVVETTSMFDAYLLELNEGNTGDELARETGTR